MRTVQEAEADGEQTQITARQRGRPERTVAGTDRVARPEATHAAGSPKRKRQDDGRRRETLQSHGHRVRQPGIDKTLYYNIT